MYPTRTWYRDLLPALYRRSPHAQATFPSSTARRFHTRLHLHTTYATAVCAVLTSYPLFRLIHYRGGHRFFCAACSSM